MRLYASAPRFITRYQYLQDHVSRLNLEPAADIPLVEVNNEEEAPLEGQFIRLCKAIHNVDV